MTRRGGKLPSVLLALVLSTIGSTSADPSLAQQTPPPTPPVTTPPQPATQPAAPVPAKPAFEPAWEHTFEAKSSAYVTATAELVFVAGPETPVVARRAGDGTEAWQAAMGSDIQPAVADGALIVQSGGRLHALDVTSGSVRWNVTNTAVLLDGEWLGLGGFGAFSGAALPLPTDAPISATATPGILVIAAGRQLRALRSADGSEAWNVRLPASIVNRAVVENGRVFVTLADRTLVALDVASGTVAWRQPIAAAPGPMTAADGQLYFGGGNGICYAYRQRDGRRQWFFDRHAPAAGAPAADQTHAYFVLLTNEVVALDRHTGNERWDERASITARLSHGIKIAAGAIFLTLGDGAALMLQGATGAVIPVRTAAPPSERRGSVHVESFDVSPDGAQVYLLNELALKYTLSAYRKK